MTTSRLDPLDFRIYRFTSERLDPITVIIEQVTTDASRVIVHCFDQCWTCWWGNHGEKPVEQFIASVDAGYMACCLIRGVDALMTRRAANLQEQYLRRICAAIIENMQGVTAP